MDYLKNKPVTVIHSDFILEHTSHPGSTLEYKASLAETESSSLWREKNNGCWMPFLPRNQQSQSTEGMRKEAVQLVL